MIRTSYLDKKKEKRKSKTIFGFKTKKFDLEIKVFKRQETK